MSPRRKPRPDIIPIFDRLTLSQKQAVIGWLTTGGTHGLGISYKEATAKILQEFGVSISSGTLQTAFTRLARRFPEKSQPQITVDTSSDGQVITINLTLKLQR